MAGRNDSGLNTYFMLTNIAFFGTNVQMEISIWTFLAIPVCKVVCAPLSWSTEHFQTARFSGRLLPEFFSCPSSPERDTTAQACRFSCFFCAAYGLLLTQTRTQCSNSASRAIAMLEKSAKISPNACAVVSLSGDHGACRKLLYYAWGYLTTQ